MTGFNKLSSGIVDSSIWSEPLATRVVWITMLAKCDQNGFVGASRSGLFRAANVPEHDFNVAISSLESPDPDSRTPDYDGRRIEKVDGGWVVLNHKRYRDFSYSSNPDAIRQRNHRLKEKDGSVTSCDVSRLGCDISVSASVSGINSSSDKKEEPIIPRAPAAPIPEVKTWRSDYETYLDDAEKVFDRLTADMEWVSLMRRYYPGVQIRLTLDKMWTLFWGTEAGWKHCKTRKSKELNWQRCIENNIRRDRVFLKKGDVDREQEEVEKYFKAKKDTAHAKKTN